MHTAMRLTHGNNAVLMRLVHLHLRQLQHKLPRLLLPLRQFKRRRSKPSG